MTLKELNNEYDKLQHKHGAKELNSIYNGGCESNPDVLFVFMNPTGKNIASSKDWKGRRSPWIGAKSIWKLFYNLSLLDENIFNSIQNKRVNEWDKDFADLVYANVEEHRYFISNLGKCTQIDARHLPNYVYEEYLYLLHEEIKIIKPKKIVCFGNQVSSIFLGENINVSKCRKKAYHKNIAGTTYDVFPIYYPVGNGIRNINEAIEDLKYILDKHSIEDSKIFQNQ